MRTTTNPMRNLNNSFWHLAPALAFPRMEQAEAMRTQFLPQLSQMVKPAAVTRPAPGRRAMQSLAQRRQPPEWLLPFVHQRRPLTVDAAGVAHIHVLGVLDKRVTDVDSWFEVTDYDDLKEEMVLARDDARVRAAAAEFDQAPGGSVMGNDEIASLWASIQAKKPTLSYTDTICASAAYNIACGASLFYASPSAIVGSIGTIMTWFSMAAALENWGEQAHIVTPAASDLKATFTPYREPTETELEDVQRQIENLNAAFLGRVRAMRGDVDDDSMRGQAFFQASEAASRNLIDAVASREQAYADLLSLIG